MRTRRSWRNQNILWRELGGPKPPPVAVAEIAMCERGIATCMNARVRRQWERQLERARHRAKLATALA